MLVATGTCVDASSNMSVTFPLCVTLPRTRSKPYDPLSELIEESRSRLCHPPSPTKILAFCPADGVGTNPLAPAEEAVAPVKSDVELLSDSAPVHNLIPVPSCQ